MVDDVEYTVIRPSCMSYGTCLGNDSEEAYRHTHRPWHFMQRLPQASNDSYDRSGTRTEERHGIGRFWRPRPRSAVALDVHMPPLSMTDDLWGMHGESIMGGRGRKRGQAATSTTQTVVLYRHMPIQQHAPILDRRCAS